jgi:hypothetical protein
LATDGVTALDGLDKALQLKAGESILILGASGGIGHLDARRQCPLSRLSFGAGAASATRP